MDATVAQAYLDYLAEEGYRPYLASGPGESGISVVEFNFEGKPFQMDAHEKNPTTFRLHYTLGTFADETQWGRALLACNSVNAEWLYITAFVSESKTAIIETCALLPQEDDFRAIFRSALQNLSSAISDWYEKLDE